MRWPRFSLRRLMLAVAIAALTLAFSIHLQRRSRAFRERARSIERIQAGLEVNRPIPVAGYDKARDLILIDWDRWKHEDDYYDALKAKYERAAAYPWLPIAPDPPEPRGANPTPR